MISDHFIYFNDLRNEILGFGFCDIQNNQDLGKNYQSQASADQLPNKMLLNPNKAFAFDQK